MSEKIAILSDIHGNMTALEAVLADAHSQGVADYWLLGDNLMPGPAGQELLDRLAQLPSSIQIRGNWEDCFLNSLDGQFDLDNPTDVYLARLSLFLQPLLKEEAITSMRELPLHQTKISHGLHFAISHHLPRKNFGRELVIDADTAAFSPLFEEETADIAIYGHIHAQVLRYSAQGQLIINPGAVGQPYFLWDKFQKDRRAQYTIIELNSHGLAGVDFRKVNFDIDKELALAGERQLPYQDLYRLIMETGETHTHDKPLLTKIHQERGYLQDVRDYLDALGVE